MGKSEDARIDELKNAIQKATGISWHSAEKAAFHIHENETEYVKSQCIALIEFLLENNIGSLVIPDSPNDTTSPNRIFYLFKQNQIQQPNKDKKQHKQ